MNEGKWHYYVKGRLVAEDGNRPLVDREILAESAIRPESAPRSPFCHKSGGPVAHSNAAGQFKTWFVTLGASERIERLPSVLVLVRMGLGQWQPFKIDTQPGSIEAISDTELLIELGPVRLPPSGSDEEND